MKKTLTLTTAILILAVGQAWAATQTNDVPVSAVVAGSCSFAVVGSIDFGSLDPVASPLYNATVVDPEINCTNLMPYTISDDLGANDVAGVPRMIDGANFIEYNFNNPLDGVGAGTGVNQPFGLTATIPAGNVTGKLAGNYADTIRFTVVW